jgi:hypothetical protein
MTIPVPKLDDRRFDALVRDSLDLVRARCPDWKELNAGDPGVTLIEVFAFLTENLIYRLNRVPEKLYVTLLNLVGAQVRPPSAAAVMLTFTRSGPEAGDVEIPIGTQVSTGDGSVTFTATEGTVLKHGQQSVNVRALQCEVVEAEPAPAGTLQSFRIRKPPIIANSGDGLDVIVGVEAKPEDLADIPSRAFGGKAFAVWKPADSYAQAVQEQRTFIVDRVSGLIIFPSGAGGAALPSTNEGRELRVWYRRGGGRAGNVAAGTLTAVKTPGLKLNVTNAGAAAGGADGETLPDAIRRTPIEVSSMRAAITARDFERAAMAVGGIARAHAFALAQQWRHADPGIVQILLVPAIATESLPEGAVTADVVVAHRSNELRTRIEQTIDGKRPLGVRVATDWTKVRAVSVNARVVATKGENVAAKATEIRKRLNKLFSPLNDQLFGRALRASDAYEAILSEPGVRYADGLRFTIGETPNRDVNDIIRDPHQPRTWFAATSEALHRSLDDGDSWSIVFQATGEQPRFVRRHGGRPGLVALGVTRAGGGAIHLSYDCGETWTTAAAAFNCEITDATWTERDGKPLLLIATRQGLDQFQPGAGTGPAPVAVDKALDTRGYYTVVASTSPSGAIAVAVSARETGGLYISSAGGVSGTFQSIGLKDKDIRTLVVHRFNARDYLWAAAQAEAGQPGDGAFRMELSANGTSGGDWQPLNIGWQGGTCQGLAFVDGLAFAASNRAGVLRMDMAAAALAWQAPRSGANLPGRDRDRPIDVVTAVAAAPGQPKPVVFAGGAGGVFKSIDGADLFAPASATEFADRIPLPQNWLYCAASHNIVVIEEDGG